MRTGVTPALSHQHTIINFFILKFLSLLGYAPQMYHCVVCQKKLPPAGNNFSFSQGGAVGKECDAPGSVAISNEAIKVMRLMLEKKLTDFLRLELSPALAGEINKIVVLFKKYRDPDKSPNRVLSW